MQQLKIPGLQSATRQRCIVCGSHADLYCSRCHVTPYCSDLCQHRDWGARHRSVCHNLMRLQPACNALDVETAVENIEDEVLSPLAPLRLPRSPPNRTQPQRDRAPTNNKLSLKRASDLQARTENLLSQSRFVPPDHQLKLGRSNQRTLNNGDNNHVRRHQQNQNNNQEHEGKGRGGPKSRYTLRPQRQPGDCNEDWNLPEKKAENKPNPQTAEPEPAAPAPIDIGDGLRSGSPKSNSESARAAAAAAAEAARPALRGGARYRLLHAASGARACVRAVPAADFDAVLHDAALYGLRRGNKLTEPAVPGQLVLSVFDDVHYRALVKRTKAADNRYKIEYVEYGNEEIVPLENLSYCPPELDLSSRPTEASIVALSSIPWIELTEPAYQYLSTLKEDVDLIATIPGGEEMVPSGSLVHLSLAKNNESVNKKLEELCTPEWKKMEEGGKDVMESEVILYPSMKTLPLPTDRSFVLEVTDFGNLQSGLVSGFDRAAAAHAAHVLGALTDQINEYCDSQLCEEAYLPVVEELCLAKLPPYRQWFRAVVIEHGAGQPTAAVLYIDYGNVEPALPVAHLRKIMPEFCAPPALAATVDIKNWPDHLTDGQLIRAFAHLNVNEEGRGQLHVKMAKKMAEDLGYEVEVPELIEAMNAA